MELRRVYVEGKGAGGGGYIDRKAMEAAPDSVDDLIAEMNPSYRQLDIKTFVLKTKAMVCYFLQILATGFFMNTESDYAFN